MNSLKAIVKRIWKDESAQGAAEYVLLLVVVIALLLLFRGQITKAFTERLGTVTSGMSQFTTDGGG